MRSWDPSSSCRRWCGARTRPGRQYAERAPPIGDLPPRLPIGHLERRRRPRRGQRPHDVRRSRWRLDGPGERNQDAARCRREGLDGSRRDDGGSRRGSSRGWQWERRGRRCPYRLHDRRKLRCHIVFISSQTHSGAFGGLAGAAVFCDSLAAAAGVPGHFAAFLGTTTASEFSPLGSARGWIRPDGLPFTDTVAGLESGVMWYPPNLNESGVLDNSDFFTGQVGNLLTSSGDPTLTCDDWTTASGTGVGGYSELRCGHPDRAHLGQRDRRPVRRLERRRSVDRLGGRRDPAFGKRQRELRRLVERCWLSHRGVSFPDYDSFDTFEDPTPLACNTANPAPSLYCIEN